MKRIFTLLSVVLLTATLWAQSPEKMTYQAVVRNSSDQLVINQGIGMQISILQGSASGIAVYTETHNVTTNANGLVTLEIGTGTTSDDFSAIDWSNGMYFLKTETDPTTAGGTVYTITGTSQLLSVPFSLYSKIAETADYNNLTNLPTLFDGNWSSLLGTTPNVSIFNNDAGYLTSYTETDPTFSAWDKHTGISITESQISDFGTYLTSYTETDPIFTNWDKDYADLTNKPVNATTTANGFMSSTDKTKLNGIETGAEVNINADWNATNGDAQILNKPTIPNALSDLSNVNTLGATSGQVLSYNGTDWTPSTNVSSQWVTNGSDIYYDGGKVGIGTSYFNANLTILNNNSDYPALMIESDATGGAQVSIKSNLNDGHEYALVSTSVTNTNGTIGAFGIKDQTTNEWRFMISNEGNIGIGTTDPRASLSIKARTGQTNNILNLRDENNNTLVVFLETGEVGIGTTQPSTKLQVVGLPEYSDNAAALAGGLTVGAFYRTGDLLKVVH